MSGTAVVPIKKIILNGATRKGINPNNPKVTITHREGASPKTI